MKLKLLVTATAVTAALTALAGCDRQADQPPMGGASSYSQDRSAPAPKPSGPIADRSTGQPTANPQGASRMFDDARITAKVRAALLASSDLDGTAITVDTEQGRVTLKGRVSDKKEIDRAVQIARAVEGVKEVDSQLSAGAAG